jgi:hypothetical protein
LHSVIRKGVAMKTILAITTRASASLVCNLHTNEVIFPDNWPYPIQKKYCTTVDEIEEFVEESGAEFIYFGVRTSGLPNRPMKVTDTEKLEKALKVYERVVTKQGWGLNGEVQP